jgi:NitT/TauT family transport system ATP-binding protein
MSEPPLLEVRNLGKRFPARHGRESPPWVIQGLSFSVRPGEFLTIVGPSGAGKSTLLNMIAQIDTVSEGEIVFDGEAMASRDARALRPGCGRRIGYVTQDDNLLPWRTTFDNVLFPIEVQGRLDDKMREHAEMLVRAVGLAGFERYYPHELSGGMRKRVSIVRTVVDESVNVILMDEPLGPLDAQTRLLLQDELLQLWQGSGRTVVFVTHDLVEAIALSDRIAIFTSAPGRIKEIREVRIPRPRDVFHIHEAPGFADIYDAIWNDLRDEIRRAREAGRA